MKIAILHPSYEGSTAAYSQLDPRCDPSVYLPDHTCTHFDIRKQTAVQQVIDLSREALSPQPFDAIVNLCDGAWGQDVAGIEVVHALERLNLPFTGARANFYDPSREAMKMACHAAGVAFPAWVMVREESDVDLALRDLRFPMLVKHPQGFASEGLFATSRVTTPEALRQQAARTRTAYGAALVEEFIEGREFTVLVTEPRDSSEEAWALEPVEFLFPPGESFKHFDLKWKDYELMQTSTVADTNHADAALAARLREAASLTFTALAGTGYGRCDFRMNEAGEIHLLEINPNCGVFYPEGSFGSADFILAADPAGHRGFLLHQIACAQRHRDRARKTWQIRYSCTDGFGLSASRAIRAGETVERYEETPFTLVSRRHVERHWRGLKRRFFDRYAWQISPEIHAIWSANPEDWRPINHSCDPNARLDGLDVVARRDIAPGEPLTLDYATFCGPAMQSFECRCGAPNCRGAVTGRQVGGDYELRADAAGLTLIARRSWNPGDTIERIAWAEPVSEPSRHTVQLDAARHALPVPHSLRYLNHSCEPTVHLDVDRGILRALRPIQPGDPLTYFYPATEWQMAEPFDCECDSPDCLGRISGAADLPPSILARYETSTFIRNSMWMRL